MFYGHGSRLPAGRQGHSHVILYIKPQDHAEGHLRESQIVCNASPYYTVLINRKRGKRSSHEGK